MENTIIHLLTSLLCLAGESHMEVLGAKFQIIRITPSHASVICDSYSFEEAGTVPCLEDTSSDMVCQVNLTG